MKETIKKLQSYIPEETINQVKKKYHLSYINRLSANENSYGTSPKVVTALQNFDFSKSNFYPDGYAQELRTKVANQMQVDEKNIVFGVGLDEIISYLSRVFLEKGDEVIIPQPTFSEYKLNAEVEGAKVISVSIDKLTGRYDYETMLTKITSRTKIIWICNPNNPTGVYEPVAALERFIKQVPQNILVLIDEAYIQFVTGLKEASALPLLKEFDNVGIMRTFSKAYGLANFRVGFIVLSSKLAEYMQTVRLPYNLNSLSQKAAGVALDDQAFVKQVQAKNAIERDKWQAFLKRVGLKYYPSQANFIYFYVDNSAALADKLLSNGFQVRRGLEPTSLRITIGKAEANVRMQNIIAQYLNKLD